MQFLHNNMDISKAGIFLCLSTGLRLGEVCALKWEDIDIDEDMIEVNHTLVYYNHAENGCYLASIHQRRKLETVPYLCWMR